jgi:hypothetical protein
MLSLAAVIGIWSHRGSTLADDLPDAVDLRPEFSRHELVPESQGSRNTCSLFAITSLAEFEAANVLGEPANFSKEYLVWAANEATGRSGDQAMFYEALAGLNSLGACEQELMPYERREDGERVPVEGVVEQATSLSSRWRVHWIKLWDVEQPLSDEQLLAIRSALADGHPVACGLRWPNDDPGDTLIHVPSPDDVYDGHSIAFVGYRDDATVEGGGEFIFRNSYGQRWGDQGYGTMSYAYARAYANDALWIELGAAGCETPITRFEAESLEILEQDKCNASSQSMRPYGAAMWSQRRHLFCQSEGEGSVEIGFNTDSAGTYRVRLLATAAPDYGIIRFSLDGVLVDGEFDLYSGRVCPAGSLELGVVTLEPGEHRLRIENVGKAQTSAGYSFGIDTIDLLAAE